MKIENTPNQGNANTTTPTFSDLIAPNGQWNQTYGLGTVTGFSTNQDLTHDGVNDAVYTFSSGQQLVVVSNYGDDVYIGDQDIPITKYKRNPETERFENTVIGGRLEPIYFDFSNIDGNPQTSETVIGTYNDGINPAEKAVVLIK